MTQPLGCGECRFCCKAMVVDDLEPAKPAETWCVHIRKDGPGCGIYETRPASCRQFKCLWLESQERTPEYRLPLEMRPDKSRVMLCMAPDDILVVRVAAGMRGHLNREPMKSFLEGMIEGGVRTFVSVDGQEFQLKRRVVGPA